VYSPLLSHKHQVALDATTTQEKMKESKQCISRISKTSKNLKIKLATSPNELHVEGLFMLATFLIHDK
jgi:hypothetical protein